MLKGLLGLALSLTLLAASVAVSGERPKAKPPDLKPESKKGWTLHLLSSSHQDIAWMNSPDACIEYRDTHCIAPALAMMAQNPDYCFVMENMLNLMEYLESHPERRDEILRFTQEGRMEWGATFNQPYESLLSGEQLVRETYFGRKWLKKSFPGCDARVYFNPDVPGRALQMQQILSKAELVNIIEEDGKPLPPRAKSVKVRLGHHALETLKLWPRQERSQSSSGEAISPARESNFVLIAPEEPVEKIVRTAAAIVPSPSQFAWQEMEFIAFAHFGMNTFTDREWGEGTESPSLFSPTDLDALQWVRVLKEAGMRMVIVTAKHHDGFCLWPSRYTEHSVKKSPWREGKGDVVREVAEACREAGLKLGIYLSPWDRHEPTYGDSSAYNKHFRNQLRELLTNYGEIGEVWFDGACGEGPNGKRQEYDWPSYYRVVRECQPKAVIFGMGPDLRWVGTEKGYGRETEWSVVPAQIKARLASPGASLDDLFVPGDMTAEDLGIREKIAGARVLAWYPAETDVSIRPGWFYHASQDKEVKTPMKLIDIYFSSVGRNGVLLLNVPPDKRGLIHENDIQSLMGMRRILDKTLETNLASGAKVKASSERGGHPARSILDEDKGTYWTTAEGVESAALEFALPEKQIFDVAMLQENIRVGQRIEEFAVEAWDGNAWRPFARGTTIGYKRLLRFPETTTDKVRLTIIKSRTSPTLSAIGLFKLAF